MPGLEQGRVGHVGSTAAKASGYWEHGRHGAAVHRARLGGDHMPRLQPRSRQGARRHLIALQRSWRRHFPQLAGMTVRAVQWPLASRPRPHKLVAISVLSSFADDGEIQVAIGEQWVHEAFPPRCVLDLVEEVPALLAVAVRVQGKNASSMRCRSSVCNSARRSSSNSTCRMRARRMPTTASTLPARSTSETSRRVGLGTGTASASVRTVRSVASRLSSIGVQLRRKAALDPVHLCGWRATVEQPSSTDPAVATFGPAIAHRGGRIEHDAPAEHAQADERRTGRHGHGQRRRTRARYGGGA